MKQFNKYKWILLSVLTTGVLYSCGGDSDPEEIDDYATDTSISVTGNASSITPVSAEIVCKANITQGGSASFELGVLYSTESEQVTEFNGSKVKTKDLVGNAYKVTLSNLKPNTTYYYRSYVTTGGINNFGKVKSFTTQSVASPNTMQADTITAFSAYLHAKREISREYANETGFSCYDGFVISERKDSIEYKGRFVSADSYYNNYKSYQNGNYRIIVNGLQPNTTYYYKAFSKINGGYTYGAVKSFVTTANFPAPLSVVNEVTYNSVTITVNTPETSLYKKVGVQYSLKKDDINNGDIVYSSNYTTETSSLVTVSGLSDQTTYYYRPVYYVLKGSTYNDYDRFENVYGDVNTFVTAIPPSNSAVGTWKLTDGTQTISFTFKSNGSGTWYMKVYNDYNQLETYSGSLSYSMSGSSKGTIRIYWDDGETEILYFKIQGKTMTIYEDSYYSEVAWEMYKQ